MNVETVSTDRPCPNCGTRNDATAFLCKVCWQSMGYLRSLLR
jgi:hypothetical protein